MFGKFGKKKQETVETEVKAEQKNDLFTLLEQTPEKSLKSTQSIPDLISKTTTKSDSSSKPTKSDTSSKPTKPDSSSITTKPDSSSITTKPDSSSITTKPDSSSTTTKLDSSSITTKLETPPKTVNTVKPKTKYVPPMSSVMGDKSQLLLLEIEKIPDKTIKPVVDFNENCLFYPILAKINEQPDNVSYFDDLVNEGVLQKQVFEKLIICPLHPDAFSSSVRLYCPKCNSLNVEKLNLYEHKKCGYITESSAYDFSKTCLTKTPSFTRSSKYEMLSGCSFIFARIG